MESPLKRKHEELSVSVLKKQKIDKRTSSLPNPTMMLIGHLSEVLTCKYNSIGTILASGSFDKNISKFFNLLNIKCFGMVLIL